LLLWLCFRRVVWAAIGVALAIDWQLFSGVSHHNLIWLTPSSTMMRHPLDVWFFLALVLHQQTGHRAWVLPTLRLYSVYGSYEDPQRLVPTLIQRG
jgi:hypothetical protein